MTTLRAGPRFSQASALLRTLWAAPQPATLQGADYRLLDVNEAYAGLVGLTRAQLVGRDPIHLQPEGDRELNRAERHQVVLAARQGVVPPPLRRRILDASGRERWFSLAVSNIAEPSAPPLWLTLLQDLSAEHDALAQAQRAEDELARWFELSGGGMLVYDSTGLIVRSNAAFEALVQRVPVGLAEAGPELQHLLAWQGSGVANAANELAPGGPPVERQALVTLADGRKRRLWARLVCLASSANHSRPHVMAVVQDRSAEDERDLAQLEMGMLMDTASIGVATYDPARGWLATQATAPPPSALPGGKAPATGALQGISRELVEPDSLPEYERLQAALRSGQRTEVRYAVRHPEMGLRWLLTRVEPRALAGGRSTTSIVTLDVTEQEEAQARNDQLLREMTTIMDSSYAGIAYLRGPVLARCNRRFERMLGFDAGAAAGASLQEIFSRGLGVPHSESHGAPLAQAALLALSQGQPYEAELPLPGINGSMQWFSLSLRGSSAVADELEGKALLDSVEAVAVLTDITRLKLQQTELEQLLRDRELMFGLSDVGIVYQKSARIERANEAMATLSGWSGPELANLDVVALYASTRECVDFEARISEALREHGRFSGERRLKRRDGSLAWVQVAVRPVAEGQGDAAVQAGVICSFVDIDERHQARETLALQAERTRAVLDSVLVGIVTVSARGIEWMNRSARRMFGGELPNFLGEPISTVATPEPEHPLRRTDWHERLQEGQAETFECRLRGRDGREFWVVGNAVLTAAEDSAEQEVTFALLDIDGRRQAEVNIAQAQASLQRVIETAPLAIALFDARSLRVQQLNQTASVFFGQDLHAAVGQRVDELCAADKAVALNGWLQAVAESHSTTQHEWVDAALAGGAAASRVWDCRIAPLGSNELLLVATDVSAQRVAERARLQAAIDQREVLVREVHHRIKNNLQGVAGLLQQNAARRPEVAAVLSEAVGQVQAIAQVYGLQVGATGPLEVAGLLRAIALSVQRTFGRNIQVQVDGDVPHLLPEAEAIPVALTLNELFTNAIKHGSVFEPATHVRCRLSVLGETLVIRISSRASLPAGFDLAQARSGVSGLGLVRALLPRRSATLSLQQDGGDVVATVELRAPSIRLP